MRICLFTPTFYPKIGGAERNADLLARELTRRGHFVGILAQWTDGPPPKNLPYPLRSYRRPPKQHLWPATLAWPLWRAYRAWRFDVVLAFWGYPNANAALALRPWLGTPIVASPRGEDLHPDSHLLHKPLVPGHIRRAYQRVDRIIAISGWMGDRARAVTDGQLPPMDVVYNGIDLDATDALRDRSRAEPPAEPLMEEPFMLHLARVAPIKRQTLAVRAVAQAREAFERHDMRYAIVGEGRSLPEVRRLIDELGVGHIITTLGSRTGLEKAWLYDHAACFVTASRQEAFGVVVIEAMAAGLPIVASDAGAHRELIADQHWGLLFRRDDAQHMADQLTAMLEADRDMMSATALGLRNRYELPKMVDGYEKACRDALETWHREHTAGRPHPDSLSADDRT